MKKKIRCIKADYNAARHHQLVLNKIYDAVTTSNGRSYVIDGEEWNGNRFEIVKEDDDYEPVPVTLKSPTRASNNLEESQELMEFFSRPQPGNCKCGGPKAKCPYHGDTKL